MPHGVVTVVGVRPLDGMVVIGVLLAHLSAALGSGPVTITEATRDVTGDGVPDHIAVRMADAHCFVDDDWCGGGDKYVGRFLLSVTVAGGRAVEHDLNRLMLLDGGGDGLFFQAAPWQLAFADYNDDGRMDFNIGRYGTCAYRQYRLFSVDDTGAVQVLAVPGGFLDVLDQVHSSAKIRPVAGTIVLEHYSNATFEWREVSYRWSSDADAFLLAGDRLLGYGPDRNRRPGGD